MTDPFSLLAVTIFVTILGGPQTRLYSTESIPHSLLSACPCPLFVVALCASAVQLIANLLANDHSGGVAGRDLKDFIPVSKLSGGSTIQ